MRLSCTSGTTECRAARGRTSLPAQITIATVSGRADRPFGRAAAERPVGAGGRRYEYFRTSGRPEGSARPLEPRHELVPVAPVHRPDPLHRLPARVDRV